MTTAIEKQQFLKSMQEVLQSSGVRLPSKNKKVFRQQSGKIIELEYFREINKLNENIFNAIDRILKPNQNFIINQAVNESRFDSSADTIQSIFEDIENALLPTFSVFILSRLTSNVGRRVASFNKNQLVNQFKSKLGVIPFLNDPFLQAQLDTFITQNVDLITSIPTQFLSKAKQNILLATQKGGTKAELEVELQKVISKEVKNVKNRAKLIARDQINKFNGTLTMLRQQSLGVEKYTWSTARDERVRARHAALNGKVFSWKKAPVSGTSGERLHPGQPINCRCVAIPVLDDFKI
jgi:SPP1 gp7 family putative phage head morphogenesis protein